MELVRFAPAGEDALRPGMQVGDTVYDLSAQFPTVAAFLRSHPPRWDEQPPEVSGLPAHRRDAVRVGPPMDEGALLYLVAVNYKAHAEEAGVSTTQDPLVFMKPYTSLVGPDDAIVLPALSNKMDYEGELAAVIGRTATAVREAHAADYVSGYTIVNDVTARDLQWTMLGKNRIVDWLSSKALDHSTPMGPGFAGPAAVGDPQQLTLRTHLNDQLMQDSSTSLMIFSVWQIIEFLTARVTLRPGDVISTGTPVGVGGFREIFLQPGDAVTIEIAGVGRLHNPVRSAATR